MDVFARFVESPPSEVTVNFIFDYLVLAVDLLVLQMMISKDPPSISSLSLQGLGQLTWCCPCRHPWIYLSNLRSSIHLYSWDITFTGMDIALTLNFDHRALIHPEVCETIRRNSLKASVRYRVDESGGGKVRGLDCCRLHYARYEQRDQSSSKKRVSLSRGRV